MAFTVLTQQAQTDYWVCFPIHSQMYQSTVKTPDNQTKDNPRYKSSGLKIIGLFDYVKIKFLMSGVNGVRPL